MTVIDPTTINPSPAATPAAPSTVSITRTEIVKMLAPIVLPMLCTALIALVTMYFTQQSQARDIAGAQKTISEWQTAKEERTAKLAVIEKTLERQADDIKEVKGDVKELLQRIPQRSP
jgi:septal ring factor EnvC (AmiA/AmiB activator)